MKPQRSVFIVTLMLSFCGVAQPMPMQPGEAYNGEVLPAGPAAVRKMRVSPTSQGLRRTEFLADGTAGDGGPRLTPPEPQQAPRTAHARQQVMFPVTETKRMPEVD